MAVRLSALRTVTRTIPHKHYFSVSGTHFCSRLSKPEGLVQPEGLGKFKKLIYLIGSRISDLPACSIVPQRLSIEQNSINLVMNTEQNREGTDN
jgi:hypothetical protein